MDTSLLNYLAAHVEFALKVYEIRGEGCTRGRRYDELGIQIAGLDYRLHNLVDLSTRGQSLDVRDGDYYKLLSERVIELRIFILDFSSLPIINLTRAEAGERSSISDVKFLWRCRSASRLRSFDLSSNGGRRLSGTLCSHSCNAFQNPGTQKEIIASTETDNRRRAADSNRSSISGAEGRDFVVFPIVARCDPIFARSDYKQVSFTFYSFTKIPLQFLRLAIKLPYNILQKCRALS